MGVRKSPTVKAVQEVTMSTDITPGCGEKKQRSPGKLGILMLDRGNRELKKWGILLKTARIIEEEL